ncbi:MAG: hypothetical protein KGO05_05665 [Chloroflexota bacterium]|nr:hypothetical protein [Chloroflexota bacterium]
MRGRREWLGMILVAMLLAGCGARVGGGSGGATPTASSQTATAPTSTANAGLSVMASLGWTKAKPGFPDTLAAAPSDPDTLYSCSGDPIGASNPADVIAFSVSHDGGATWQTTNTPAQAGRCESLAVSPTNSQAVAFLASTCRQDCGEGSFLLYASLDGGARWTSPALPSSGPLGVAVPYAWVGATLFAAVGNSAPHVLAASRNGGPFAWVNTSFAPLPFTSVGNTLYATLSGGSCPQDPTGCVELARSSDLGVSWSRVLPMYQGYNVRVLDVAPDGVTMIGQEARAASSGGVFPLLRSTDGGASWRALPGFPAGKGPNDTNAVFAAPDGAVFARLFGASGAPPCAIFKLTPGASAWACSAQTADQFHFALVSWDAHGHPARVWGLVEAGYGITDLWSHPA